MGRLSSFGDGQFHKLSCAYMTVYWCQQLLYKAENMNGHRNIFTRFTRYEAVNGGAKCRKWGGLRWLGALKVNGNVTIR